VLFLSRLLILAMFWRVLTPLNAACRYKLPNTARYFLELGDNLRTKNADGNSPLHHALSSDILTCYHANDDSNTVFNTVKVLLDLRAKLDLVKWEYSRKNPVSTFELGVTLKDKRVRELFHKRRDKTPVIAHGGFYIGHI
jgi:hypothetical protein